MALTKHNITIAVDSAPRVSSLNVPLQSIALLPNIELWFGDITVAGAITREDILVASSDPKSTLIGNQAVLKWAKLLMGSPEQCMSLYPNYNVDVYNSTSPIDKIIFWNPTFGPLNNAQSAPYKTDDIFIGAHALWGHVPKSILIPLEIGSNGFCDSTIMLQSLLRSALKYGGWHKYTPKVIKIVLSSADPSAIAAFDEIARNYDTLRGGINKAPGTSPPTAFPLANGQPYLTYVDQSNSWMSNMYKDVAHINQISEFQVFAINMYTTSYFTAMQSVLRNALSGNAIAPIKSNGILPNYHNAGYTDLGNPDYQALIPLLAVFSAGLLNIPAYNGTTYRGEGTWTAYNVGDSIRILNYMSSADEFYDPVLLPWPSERYRDENGRKVTLSTTPPPWNNQLHIRTQSLTAKDISPYSAHQYEREHVYDYEFIQIVTNNTPYDLQPPARSISTVQVPKSIFPSLK